METSVSLPAPNHVPCTRVAITRIPVWVASPSDLPREVGRGTPRRTLAVRSLGDECLLEAWGLPDGKGLVSLCRGSPPGLEAHLPTCHDTGHIDKPNSGCSMHHLQRYPHQELEYHVESQVFYPV